MGYLTVITFFPVFGALAMLLVPKGRDTLIRWIAVAATAIPLALSLVMWSQWDYAMVGATTEAGFQFVEKVAWIPQFGIQYFVGVDGLSFPLVLLTGLLGLLAVIASWNITKGVKGYHMLFMLLVTGMYGVFVALDFFLFYVFWEVMLLPMYFLIGIWGGPRREYAAIKFFLYTLVGSVLLLLGMLAVYFNSDPHTFNMLELMGNAAGWAKGFQIWVFLAFYIGFAIKVPAFPFHTWLPDAHVEAPTPISVILAGVLLKMGTYGLLRISFPMLPEGTVWFAYTLAIIGVINIVYGAFVAMAQTDFKKLVAYSSVSHMGFVLLGMASLTAYGMNGAVFQMISHGILSGGLFLVVGVIYDRAHHRDLDRFGGLALHMPKYFGVSLLLLMGSLGLPSMSGFIGEALSLLGAFTVYRTLTIIAVSGLILTAVYILWTVQRVYFGQINEEYKGFPDMSLREAVTLVPLVVLTFVLGIFPSTLIDIMDKALRQIINVVG
ncbi:MAG: NADH-quinone oxidoreductase subunit M [bacterium]